MIARTLSKAFTALRFIHFLALVIFILAPIPARAQLPVLGENSATNLEYERKLGEDFYQQLLARGLIETNPLLDRYINELGNRLLAGIENRARRYRFFIVKDPSINAFAVPGGFVGVHVGLINQARTEHQLASVMAHEIAHIRLRHSLDLLEKAADINGLTVLSVLAGVLLGGSNAELGSALIAGGVAGQQQSLVSFTRENEYEADRLGIALLQNAGFDSRGMVEFFQILDRNSDVSELQNIEYLRTHPINQNRIAEAQNRVQPIISQDTVTDYFSMFRDFLHDQGDWQFLPSGTDFEKGLSYRKQGRYMEAHELLSKLYQQNKENIWYGYAHAQNLENLGRWDEAETVYRKLLDIFPDDFAVSMQLVQLLKSTKRYEDALAITRIMESQHPDIADVYARLSEIYRALERDIQSMIAEAQYHQLTGNYNRAVALYDDILALKNIDITTVARIRQKRAELIESKTAQ